MTVGRDFRLGTASKGTEGNPTVMNSSSVAGGLINNQSVMATENNYLCETETEEYTPEDRPISTETTRQLTEFLEASMPDFSDLLGVDPSTPSPMRQLLNEEPPPECIVPSDQLFSKYLQDLSPVNSPDNFSIDIDLEPQEPSIILYNPEPSPLVSIATIIDQQQPSSSLSMATSINHQEPTEQILDLTMTRTITPCTPEDPITTNQEEPLDLSMKLKPANNLNIKPKEIPTNF
ncbi:unnamed protein product [Mytilus coruscus]|uniref:Uncharacterized protein n=1 Tax=Mytilus coruscus TaxID=42192 RepID=A0A6J8AD66_MYTCO|nr:unnamed protein product [Mytilus coruscus]